MYIQPKIFWPDMIRQTIFTCRLNIIPENKPILCFPLNNLFTTNYDYVKLTFGVYSMYIQIKIYVHTTKDIFAQYDT